MGRECPWEQRGEPPDLVQGQVTTSSSLHCCDLCQGDKERSLSPEYGKLTGHLCHAASCAHSYKHLKVRDQDFNFFVFCRNNDNSCHLWTIWDSLVAQTVKHLLAMRETQVWSLGQEDPLEKEMATHSSSPAWKIPWTEEWKVFHFLWSI